MPSLPVAPPRLARAAAIALVSLLAACGDKPKAVVGPVDCAVAPAPAAEPAVVPLTSPHDALFADVGAAAGVPAALLRAISYVETRWQMIEGQEEFEGMPVAHGLMALRGARVGEGARLAGIDDGAVRRDPAANVRAAAALLRAAADSLTIDRADPEAWAAVVAGYSGIAGAAGRTAYVDDVYAVMRGRRAPAAAVAADVRSSSCAPPPTTTYPVDQVGATWRTSPNFNQRMAGEGGQVHMVIIHSCEGGYAGCWSWLSNAESQVSAHYVVREDGAEITQLVRESARAWHIGAIYDSTLNANHDGRLHGVQSNHFTIGIEHAGYASQVSWPVAQIDASAQLLCDVARRWGIPRDRLHIVAHGQLQPWNRTDPGPNWPWADYLARVDRYCTA